MKNLLIQILICLFLVGSARAQSVNFVNRTVVAGRAVIVPVFDTDGVTQLAGPGYQAMLYGGPAGSSEAALKPALKMSNGVLSPQSPTPFLNDPNRIAACACQIAGGILIIQDVQPGKVATLQLRAWKVSSGASWEDATIRGQSALFDLKTGDDGSPLGPPGPPPDLTTMKSFSLKAQAPAAFTDDFSDGNDEGWRHYDVLAAVGGQAATFEVKDGVYHLHAPLSPKPAVLGPPRAGAFFPNTEFTDFSVSVDVLGWDDQAGTMFGVLARINNIGIGRSSGYYFRYCSNCKNLDIDYIRNEQGFTLARREITLDPAKDYRFVFTGIGEYLKGELYDLEAPATPLVTLTALDKRYASGLSGLLIANFKLLEGDAVFDNYVAKVGEGEIPGYATSISRTENGSAKILFKGNPGHRYSVQASEDLGGAQWTTLGTPEAGPDRRFEFLDAEAATRPMRIYRLLKN